MQACSGDCVPSLPPDLPGIASMQHEVQMQHRWLPAAGLHSAAGAPGREGGASLRAATGRSTPSGGGGCRGHAQHQRLAPNRLDAIFCGSVVSAKRGRREAEKRLVRAYVHVCPQAPTPMRMQPSCYISQCSHFSRPDDPRPVSTSLNDSDAITAMPILQRPGATSKEIARERDLLSDLVTRAQHISGLQVKRHLDWLCYTQHVRYFCMQRQAGALASTGAQRGHGNQRDAAAFVHRAGARHCKPAQPFAQQSARLGAPLLVPLPCMTTRDSLSCRDCRLHTALHACTGAPRKQAAILHSTLLRILTPRQLEPDVIAAIQEQCQRWTQQLRGTTLSITRAW